jgi:hypothetical protein
MRFKTHGHMATLAHKLTANDRIANHYFAANDGLICY